jgi:hypothetical protein
MVLEDRIKEMMEPADGMLFQIHGTFAKIIGKVRSKLLS